MILNFETCKEIKENTMNFRQILNGIIGGLAGGAVFGMMMGMMGMLPMIGKMVGQPSAIAGFIVHMINSGIIGAAFAIIFGRSAASIKGGLGFGSLYGVIWWLLGPLTLMPLFMGMGFGVNWNMAAAINMMPSLMGHLIYGIILGIVYSKLHGKSISVNENASADLSTAKSR
jgi:uncharacterized membrane protein YagU involved in acid resistance